MRAILCVVMGVPSVTGPGPEAFAPPEKNAGAIPGEYCKPGLAIVRGQLASSQAKLPRETYPPGDLADVSPAGD